MIKHLAAILLDVCRTGLFSILRRAGLDPLGAVFIAFVIVCAINRLP